MAAGFDIFSIDELLPLVDSSTYDYRQRQYLLLSIYSCACPIRLDQIKQGLLHNQIGFNGIVNPSQTQINKYLKSFIHN